MEKSVKAALLSAFVFPGAGHLYLRKYVVGALLSCSTLILLIVVISKAVERALTVVDKILAGEIAPDVASIAEVLSRNSTASDTLLLNAASFLLLFLWLAGIAGSYLIGRGHEKEVHETH